MADVTHGEPSFPFLLREGNGLEEEAAPVAHYRFSREMGWEVHTVAAHLHETANLASAFAAKLRLARVGRLVGLLHDFGKVSTAFGVYLKAHAMKGDQDGESEGPKRGQVDHSTAGAQLAWRHLQLEDPRALLLGQWVSLAIASHHSGLMDCLSSSVARTGDPVFLRRMEKPDDLVHLKECVASAPELVAEARALLEDPDLLGEVSSLLEAMSEACRVHGDGRLARGQLPGLVLRFLFSALLDADRLSTARFMRFEAPFQEGCPRPPWDLLCERLEARYLAFEGMSKSPDSEEAHVNEIRARIARHCLQQATRPRGIFSSTAPTGAGKTLANLRFALSHARHWDLDRVIVVLPFTSIIEQNAAEVRSILEPATEDAGRHVLEHHSNLTPEVEGWQEKLAVENWDKPVIFTTSVQLLEALFGAGTRGARRMHALAKSVILLDEIQALPVRCIHLFNNAMNFLATHAGSTVVLSTATQPLLHRVDGKKGALDLGEGRELMPDVEGLFRALHRVQVVDGRKPGGWTLADLAQEALGERDRTGSCLVILNTKAQAFETFRAVAALDPGAVYHLSTAMCPAHRREVLARIRHHLDRHEPVICVATNLIEAGVDVDFGSVIRALAGLDAIAQAAGRCNRHGRRATGRVLVVDIAGERLGSLEDLRVGQAATLRVLREFKVNPGSLGGDLLAPQALTRYFEYAFFERGKDMDYPVGAQVLGHDDTLLNLLSSNHLVAGEYQRAHGSARSLPLMQSFQAAARAFRAIDSPSEAVIVPYGEQVVRFVHAVGDTEDPRQVQVLLQRLQPFSVPLTPRQLESLCARGLLRPLGTGGALLLEPGHYDAQCGVSPSLYDEGGCH